jgi:hypothetical protein
LGCHFSKESSKTMIIREAIRYLSQHNPTSKCFVIFSLDSEVTLPNLGSSIGNRQFWNKSCFIFMNFFFGSVSKFCDVSLLKISKVK